jgi:EAL domain-containing protein (putative c-di-GMP-specific phosphodiesterase class I)
MGMFKNRRTKKVPAATARDAAPGSNEALLEARLRDAVAGGRFHLHYQPLVAVGTGDIVGVEALLRWESDAGRVAPATFMPVLEATGLVNDVGPWVLARACRDARTWFDTEPDLFVAVNVSPQQLEPGFADWVLGTLGATGVAPARLALELIAPAFIVDPAAAWIELRRLKTAGVRLFVDDFGALGSSIADLRRFAVDAVKIDTSFVAGVGRNAEDDAVVTGIITLAHALGMRTIAEGVETADQLRHLQDLGCDLAQGFHIMEPVDAAAVAGVLQRAAVSRA